MRREKNTGRKAIGLFALLILIALLCFGVFIYIYLSTKNGGTVGKDVVSVSKIMVFTGIFFLVVAFGYVLPAIINGKKSKGGTQVTNPNDTANEANMRVALEKYTPAGESLIAGIRTGVKKSSVTCVFGDCVIVDDEIRPFEEGENKCRLDW